jgi:hypothetical protein
MTNEQAQSAIVTSAVLVGAIYMYRRMVEPDQAQDAPKDPRRAIRQLAGIGPTAPLGRFITGWGFTYLVLAAIEGPAPDIAGMLAWLILLGCLLGNGRELARTLDTQLKEARTSRAQIDPLDAPIDFDAAFAPLNVTTV